MRPRHIIISVKVKNTLMQTITTLLNPKSQMLISPFEYSWKLKNIVVK